MVRGRQLVVLTILLFSVLAYGQTGAPSAPSTAAPVGQAAAGTAFDVRAAVDTYLAKMPPAQRARSDAYFEGGYWLQLVDLIYGLAVASILLWLQISSRISDWAEDRTHSRT